MESPEFSFDATAFMSGQIRSKIWMISKLENYVPTLIGSRPVTIWLLGGWYGMTAFLMASRDRLRVASYQTFDIDPHATAGALVLNESLVASELFKAQTLDVSLLDYEAHGVYPDIVINTSVEHMPDDNWWHSIPSGMIVVLQSNDMPHDDDHVSNVTSVSEICDRYKFDEIFFTGDISLNSDELFRRFMVIGRK